MKIILSFLRLCLSTAFQTLVDDEGYFISSKGLANFPLFKFDSFLWNYIQEI